MDSANFHNCKGNVREVELKGEQRLWKYMDFVKLISMLNYNRLHLRRLDKFEDSMEGKIPLFVMQHLPSDMKEQTRQLYEERRRSRFVDCWTRFDGKESYAMWKIYSKEYGLAVETDISSLSRLLPEEAIIIGVKYYDFREEFERNFDNSTDLWHSSKIEEISEMERKFSATKSVEYEYEKEVRIIFPLKSDMDFTFLDVDVKQLIRRIIISPYESDWFYELVADIVHNKYGLENVEIIKSDIDVVF